jgi:hypothetical protein
VNPIRVRRFNQQGLTRMREFVDSQTGVNGQTVDFKRDLHPILTDASLTLHVPNVVEADADRTFRRRYDLAEYLHGLIPRLGLADPTRDAGLWAWLALLWFDQLAPVMKGVRRVGEVARWEPQIGNGRRYYRHFILGPYVVFNVHATNPRRAEVLLSEKVSVTTSEIYRECVESPLVGCGPVMDAIRRLYWDSGLGKLKSGAGSKLPGGSRRLLEVLMQFDRTFDLHVIKSDHLLTMLPREFNKYR